MSVTIEKNICKGCGICVAYCPKKTLNISNERNLKGTYVVEQVDEENCVSCGMCQDICPDLAIRVRSEADAP